MNKVRTGCRRIPAAQAAGTGHAAVDSESLPPLSLIPSPECRYLGAVIVTDNPCPSVHRIPLAGVEPTFPGSKPGVLPAGRKGNGGDGGNRTPMYGFSVRRLDHVGHISKMRTCRRKLHARGPHVTTTTLFGCQCTALNSSASSGTRTRTLICGARTRRPAAWTIPEQSWAWRVTIPRFPGKSRVLCQLSYTPCGSSTAAPGGQRSPSLPGKSRLLCRLSYGGSLTLQGASPC